MSLTEEQTAHELLERAVLSSLQNPEETKLTSAELDYFEFIRSHPEPEIPEGVFEDLCRAAAERGIFGDTTEQVKSSLGRINRSISRQIANRKAL